jgi:hypothetical protein
MNEEWMIIVVITFVDINGVEHASQGPQPRYGS